MKITLLGAGAWGTALAKILHENGNAVTLWDINAEMLREIQNGRNEKYLPGVALPKDWKTETDFSKAIGGAECVVIAVPSEAFRSVTAKLKGHPGIFASVTKGIEFETGETMSRILREYAPANRVVALSGPSFAREVALGIPTTVVCASESDDTAKTVQGLFHRPEFRIYRSTDILGVEYGGALKNIIAIAAGVSDGLGYGDNTKAGLVTRALSEIRRLGVACGAQAETFAGLSGLGDLMLTCFSKQSRNRDLGERLGRGEKIGAIQASHPKLAEGYPTARSAHRLAREKKVQTPIIDEVHAMLYEGKEPKKTVSDLISRRSRPRIKSILRRSPFADWPRSSAVQTLCRVELCSAMGTNSLREKSVESLAAFSAAPEFAERRRGFAGRTRETFTARNLGDACERLRLFQAAPAVHQDERRNDAQPTNFLAKIASKINAATPMKPMTLAAIKLLARPKRNHSSERKICPPSSG